MRKKLTLLLLLSLIVSSLTFSAATVNAQDPTAEPTEEAATAEPTVAATAPPTEEAATAEPTVAATAEPTEEAAPAEPAIAPTVEATAETLTPTVETTETVTVAEEVSAAISVSNAVTSFQIQNTGLGSATVQVIYYSANGTQALSTSETVLEGSNINIYQPTVAGLPSPFNGSVVLQSNVTIGAVGAELFNWNNGRSGAANYSGIGSTEIGNKFYLPTITKFFGGGQYNTKIYIQNAQSTATSVTIKYYNGSNGSEVVGAQQTVPVPGNGSVTVEQETNAGLSNGFAGGAVLEAPLGGQVAVVVNAYNNDGRLTAYNGFVDGATKVYGPTITRAFGGGQFTTSFQVMALEAGTTTGTAKYYGPSGLVKSVPLSLIQFQSLNRYQGDAADQDIGNGFFGALVVEADKKVLVIVNSAAGGGGLATVSYNGFTSGANKFFLPSVTKQFGGGNYTSGFQIMNVGTGGNADVTVKFYKSGVAAPFKTDTYSGASAIGQFKSINTYMGNVTEAAAGFVGSVSAESTNGVPIVIIGNNNGAAVNGDGATSYNGVK